MSFGELIWNLSPPHRATVRRLEQISKKIVNTEAAVNFNHVCLQEDLLPIYTNIRTHDEAVRQSKETLAYRRQLVTRQLNIKKEELIQLRQRLQDMENEWTSLNIEDDRKAEIYHQLQLNIQQHKETTMTRTKRKLVRLNGGSLKYPTPPSGYINLTTKILSTDEEELLNLGLNCHLLSKPPPYGKRLELESLLDNILDLAKKGKVKVDEGIREEIQREARVERGHHRSSIIKRRHLNAAKALKQDTSITIRRADKAACYVLIPTEEYISKINNILSDSSKFTPITRNPTDDIKTRANKIIRSINAKRGENKLPLLTGEYGVGYCYGNVKTHKTGNPLRPIISQIPAPTYNLAKHLNSLLTPFIPSDYSLASPTDFLDLLKESNAGGTIASLDVESLFTNVPVDKTIQFILEEVYPEDAAPKIDISKLHLKSLLEICTKEAPFISPDGRMFQQVDGVAMGSPLGVLFASFFMGRVERDAFTNLQKPAIYARYVDDIFVLAKDETEIQRLQQHLQETSGLNFTVEHSSGGRLPFLDVLVNQQQGKFNTEVYCKPTNPGLCLNGRSECPDRYKRSTISAYVRRALTHCSSWSSVHKELERITQVLINNGYSNKEVSKSITHHLDKWHSLQNPSSNTNTTGQCIRLFYRAYMNSQYKQDEQALRKIITDCVKPTNADDKIDLTIYYKNKKTHNFILKNSPKIDVPELQRSHLVYQYTCTTGNCAALPSRYIGMTTTKLSRRLTLHLSNGAPKKHAENVHQLHLTREMMVQGTEILQYNSDHHRLQILEALIIKDRNPCINSQVIDNYVIPSNRNFEPRIKIMKEDARVE